MEQMTKMSAVLFFMYERNRGQWSELMIAKKHNIIQHIS